MPEINRNAWQFAFITKLNNESKLLNKFNLLSREMSKLKSVSFRNFKRGVIQIFGKKKCFDTKKAERYFKERRIKFQKIDLIQKGISPGELKSIAQNIGLKNLINIDSPFYAESNLEHTQDPETIKEILLDYVEILKTPIVRNGKKATVGYKPDVWSTWE